MSQTERDIVVNANHDLAWRSVVYLNGERQTHCLEYRVKSESFMRPAAGELIIACLADGQLMHTSIDPQPPDSFPYRGQFWARRVTGQVFVDLV